MEKVQIGGSVVNAPITKACNESASCNLSGNRGQVGYKLAPCPIDGISWSTAGHRCGTEP